MKMSVLSYVTLLLLMLPSLMLSYDEKNSELENMEQFSIEELMELEIELASGVEETLFDAPLSMVVITEQDIKMRGYTSVDEIVRDLPGFDVIQHGAANHIVQYQRGYRTPRGQRTLFMIDGHVENNIWHHTPTLSRQYSINNIKRVEVLYGPASAVYGANAFLGIINIVTKKGSDLETNGVRTVSSVQGSSPNMENLMNRSVDISSIGKYDDLSFSLAARFFSGEDYDLSGRWKYLSNEHYASDKIWGPINDLENYNGFSLLEYHDPVDNYSVFGNISYKSLTIGFSHWKTAEGYGGIYPSDRGKPHSDYGDENTRYYLEFEQSFTESFKVHTTVRYLDSFYGGDWIEALPDWNAGMEEYSYISFTDAVARNNSWLFKQNFETVFFEDFIVTGGIKYERKNLTKSYDLPGYWDGAFSSIVPADSGPHGLGAGIGHSRDASYVVPEHPHTEMPKENLILTYDYGAFLQGIYNFNKFRVNTGIRFDRNSIYGNSVNPRGALIYKFSKNGAAKLFYGEAFQEPPPQLLFGGWSGRQANPDLKPEKVKNIEFSSMYNFSGRLMNEINFYYSMYSDVIKEEAENAGERTVFGIEYRLNYSIPNFISGLPDISGYMNYSYTYPRSSKYFDHLREIPDPDNPGETKIEPGWIDRWSDLGDIAPHKINFGINLPITKMFNIFIKANWVSAKKLYSRNALNYSMSSETEDKYFDSDGNLKPYLLLYANVASHYKYGSIAFKIDNLLDSKIMHSGVESASSGDGSVAERSLGWHNSLIPIPGRTFWLTLTAKF